jgi:hypothetical protein
LTFFWLKIIIKNEETTRLADFSAVSVIDEGLESGPRPEGDVW